MECCHLMLETGWFGACIILQCNLGIIREGNSFLDQCFLVFVLNCNTMHGPPKNHPITVSSKSKTNVMNFWVYPNSNYQLFRCLLRSMPAVLVQNWHIIIYLFHNEWSNNFNATEVILQTDIVSCENLVLIWYFKIGYFKMLVASLIKIITVVSKAIGILYDEKSNRDSINFLCSCQLRNRKDVWGSKASNLFVLETNVCAQLGLIQRTHKIESYLVTTSWWRVFFWSPIGLELFFCELNRIFLKNDSNVTQVYAHWNHILNQHFSYQEHKADLILTG